MKTKPLGVVLLLSVSPFACAREVAPPPPPPKVDVVQAVDREVLEWDEYTARLEAVESVEIRPRVTGYLQSVHFQDGAIVKKGDLLFVVDPRPYEAILRSADANLALAESRVVIAKSNFNRVLQVRQRHANAVSQEEAEVRESGVEQADASAQQAKAEVDAAKLNLEFTRVTAPVAGRIGRKLVTEGNLVNGGLGAQSTLLTTIVSLDPIYAYFEADERSYLKYTRLALAGERKSSREYKNPVHIGLADETGFPRDGVMDFVDNQFDRGTGTMVGRALIPNPDMALVPGLFARLRLPGTGKYRAVLIPDAAIGSDQAQKFVYVVDGDGKVNYRAIETGAMVDGLRIVRKGLAPQDWVVVGGTQRARPGLKVDPQRRPAAVEPAKAAGATSRANGAEAKTGGLQR